MATQMATTAAATTAAAEVRGLAADRRGRAAAVVRTLALHSKVATVGALVAVAVTLAAVRAPPTMVLGFRVVVGGGFGVCQLELLSGLGGQERTAVRIPGSGRRSNRWRKRHSRGQR